jgi:hypothetical protein
MGGLCCCWWWAGSGPATRGLVLISGIFVRIDLAGSDNTRPAAPQGESPATQGYARLVTGRPTGTTHTRQPVGPLWDPVGLCRESADTLHPVMSGEKPGNSAGRRALARRTQHSANGGGEARYTAVSCWPNTGSWRAAASPVHSTLDINQGQALSGQTMVHSKQLIRRSSCNGYYWIVSIGYTRPEVSQSMDTPGPRVASPWIHLASVPGLQPTWPPLWAGAIARLHLSRLSGQIVNN